MLTSLIAQKSRRLYFYFHSVIPEFCYSNTYMYGIGGYIYRNYNYLCIFRPSRRFRNKWVLWCVSVHRTLTPKKQAMSEESLLSLLKDPNFLLCQFQQTHKDFQISFNLKSFPKNWVIFQTSFSLFSWSLSVAVWNRRNIMNPRPIFSLKPWAKRNLAVLIQQS